MWYEEVVRQFNIETEYTRQEIYDALVKEKPDLTFNSFKWIISEMVENGIICRKQRGKYVLQNNSVEKKQIYKPYVNELRHRKVNTDCYAYVAASVRMLGEDVEEVVYSFEEFINL